MAAARAYGDLSFVSDASGARWCVDKVEPHVAIRLKQLFPRIPKTGVGPFYFPADSVHAADLKWFTERYPLRISSSDARKLRAGQKSFVNTQAEMERILLPDYAANDVPGLRDGQSLRHYQIQAVDILRKRHRLLLGDEGGLGKTYVAGGFLCAEPGALPAAVVCDPHMPGQWFDKLTAFTHLRVHCIQTTKPYTLPEADVYIFKISQIAGWSDILNTGFFKCVIYDEPQSLRTGKSTAKGAAAELLTAHASYVLGLTATPIYNYGDEMWNVLQFIDDTVLGTWEEFTREWCNAVGNGKYRINDPKALGTYLREQYVLLRRLKADVGLELPKVSRIVEHVDYDSKTVKSIEDLAHQLAIRASEGTFVQRGQAARDLDIMVRQSTGVAKAKTVAKFVRLLIEAGEPVLLAGWHREVYDIWLQEFADLKPAMYTGSEGPGKKVKEKDRFINGETDLMIISLRSGAGLDGLQYRCSTVVFGELDWSPGIHQQIIWRLDRDGQTDPVSAFFLVTDDGSDPPIMEVNGIKASEAVQIVDPELTLQRASNDDGSNVKRLVERYLRKKRGQAA